MGKQDLVDQRSQLVVKRNDLIQKERYELTAAQQKFICYLVSKIKPTDTEIPEFEISVTDYCQVCGINPENFYDDFKTLVKKFLDDSKAVETDEEYFALVWFSELSYIKGQGKVKAVFSRRMEKYFLNLAGNFTQYELINILALKSKYAIRLFELFKSYAYREIIEIDTENLKYLLYIDNYKNFADFRRFVLSPALKEINQYTELNVTTEEKRTGRKITSVIFHIGEKRPAERYKSLVQAERLLGVDPDQLSLFDKGLQYLEE